MSRVIELVAEEAGEERADRYLFGLFNEHEDLSHLSRSQIQRLLDEGSILIDGKSIRGKDNVREGAVIRIQLPEPVSLEVKPEPIPIHILYEDAHLVVINKQPGLTVHPSETQVTGTLVNALLYHIKDLSGIGGVLRPGIVHRIDKNTSGAIVISKDDATHLGLSKLFSTHTIERRYWALSYGSMKSSEPVTLSTLVGRNPTDRKKMMIDPPQGGRKAVSHLRSLEAYAVAGKAPFASLIEAKLETGRTHQVRVHLNHLGNSILGDTLYGVPSENQSKWKNLPRSVQEAVQRMPGQALHARVLGFRHPITGKDLYFEAEPFQDFTALMNELRRYT